MSRYSAWSGRGWKGTPLTIAIGDRVTIRGRATPVYTVLDVNSGGAIISKDNGKSTQYQPFNNLSPQ